MKILIEISEDAYNKLMQKSMLMSASAIDEAVDAVKKGLVLPKHGRLIDADRGDLQSELFTFTRYTAIDEAPYEDATSVIDKAPTVVPAEKGEN